MKYEIKNCPFCGGFAKLESKSKTIIDGELAYVTYVRCVKCCAHGRRFRLWDGKDPRVIRKKAIDAWNRRVNYGHNV